MISTHALTWSATTGNRLQIAHFQISTHALTWSATCSVEFQGNPQDFNSRTHVECDLSNWFLVDSTYHFNSRTHVECDQYNANHPLSALNFNSRTHVECDGKGLFDIVLVHISTHALTWSATNGTKPN